MSARTDDPTKTSVITTMVVSTKSTLGAAGRQQSPASGVSGWNVRSAIIAASKLAGGEPTDVDDDPAPTS